MRGKRVGRRIWILRGALATMGLAGAVYAADQVAAPPASDDVGKTITNQRIKQGERATANPDFVHQAHSLSHEQMLELVTQYDTEATLAIENGENTRFAAYRAHDIIRLACIDDKLVQMKDVIKAAAPRLRAFPGLAGDELVMRQHFLVLQQAHIRVLELVAELEACMGDVLDAVTLGHIKEEAPATDSVYDPTRPPSPTRDVERPAEASPYR
jgi:hypothetical protein